MFCITRGSGFHIQFKNGWRVSVQFGPGSYCDNYNMTIGVDDIEAGKNGSSNAELAVLNPEGDLMPIPWDEHNDTVTNRSSPEDALKLMIWASEQ